MAFTIIVLSGLVKFQPMSRVANQDNFHDLGKLMFAFIMLWAYFSVSQLLIIWSANLPEEVPFYLERLHGPWAPISIAMLLLQFVLPFVMLLSRDLKRNPAAVRWVALLVLVMRVVDITWTIGPVFRTEGSSLHWLDFAVVLAMGARVARVVLAQSGRAFARPGARPVLQGSSGSWRTLSTSTARRRSKATASVTAASSGSSSSSRRRRSSCQLIVWGAFEFMEWRVDRGDAARAPLAAERARPAIERGRMVTSTPESPQPALLVTEPIALGEHRANEASSLAAYGWVDRGAGRVRIPIDRAKTLLLERGLPTRPGAAPAAAPAAPAPAPASAAPAAAPRTWRRWALRDR